MFYSAQGISDQRKQNRKKFYLRDGGRFSELQRKIISVAFIKCYTSYLFSQPIA